MPRSTVSAAPAPPLWDLERCPANLLAQRYADLQAFVAWLQDQDVPAPACWYTHGWIVHRQAAVQAWKVRAYALDAVDTICPLPVLPRLLAEGGGRNMVTLIAMRDLRQAAARRNPGRGRQLPGSRRRQGGPPRLRRRRHLPGQARDAGAEILTAPAEQEHGTREYSGGDPEVDVLRFGPYHPVLGEAPGRRSWWAQGTGAGAGGIGQPQLGGWDRGSDEPGRSDARPALLVRGARVSSTWSATTARSPAARTRATGSH